MYSLRIGSWYLGRRLQKWSERRQYVHESSNGFWMFPANERLTHRVDVGCETRVNFWEFGCFHLLDGGKGRIIVCTAVIDVHNPFKERIGGFEVAIDEFVDWHHESFLGAKMDVVGKILNGFGDENQRTTCFLLQSA